jgi:hypothetical protein
MDPRVIVGNYVHFFLKIFCGAFSIFYNCNSSLTVEYKKEAFSVSLQAKFSLVHLADSDSESTGTLNLAPMGPIYFVFCRLCLPPSHRGGGGGAYTLHCITGAGLPIHMIVGRRGRFCQTEDECGLSVFIYSMAMPITLKKNC